MDTSNSVKNKPEKPKKYIGLIGKFQNIAQIEQAHHASFTAPGFSVDTVPANGPGYRLSRDFRCAWRQDSTWMCIIFFYIFFIFFFTLKKHV